MNANAETHNMALYCDFENVALGVRDANDRLRHPEGAGAAVA